MKAVRWSSVVFVALMVGLTGLFAYLGTWQLERLGEKEALIASVTERTVEPPRALPPVAEWVGFDDAVFDYRTVTATGTFVPDETVLVFTSLASDAGRYSGPGYWVVTPLALEEGGYVLVNRGFVPQRLRANYATGADAPVGTVTVTGIARGSEQATSFTPGPDLANRIEWVRSIPRISAFLDPAITPLAPVIIDAGAGEDGALPQGGGTTLSFPNNHLGYAITWFGFALLTPLLLLFWLFRGRLGGKAP